MKKHFQAKLCILTGLILMLTGIIPAVPVTAAGHHADGQFWVSGQIGEEYVHSEYYLDASVGDNIDSRLTGISYDRASNTLSLTNFNYPTFQMEIANMGANFKIKLTGTNAIRQIWTRGSGAVCSIEFTGDGILELNKDKEDPTGFGFGVYGSDSVLSATGGATVISYAQDGESPIEIFQAKSIDCVKGEYTPALKAEAETRPNMYWVVTDPSADAESISCNSCYTKKGEDGKYMLEYGFLYKLIENPGSNKYYKIYYEYLNQGEDAEIPADYVKLDETVQVYEQDINSRDVYASSADSAKWICESIYVDINTTKMHLYQVDSFASFTNVQGQTIALYRAKNPAVEKDFASKEEMTKAGFKQDMLIIENSYNLSATGSSWTLKAHTHKGTAVAAVAAKCTESGSKAYYTCSCGKAFEDAACTKEITNLDVWKLEKATGHDFGKNEKKCSVCGAANPDYKAPVANKKAVAAEEGGKVTTTAKGEATVTEVKKTTKKSITVSSTATVNGVEYKVTTINANAFKNASKATTVTLPDTITKINASAFAKSKVKTVKLTVKKGGKLTVNKNAFKKSKVAKVQLTVSKKATTKEVNKLKKAFTKAGIKSKNIKVKKK